MRKVAAGTSVMFTRQAPAEPGSVPVCATRDLRTTFGHSRAATRSPSASTTPGENANPCRSVSARHPSARHRSGNVNRSRVSSPESSRSVRCSAARSYGSKLDRSVTAAGSTRRRARSTSTRADTRSPKRCSRGSTSVLTVMPRSSSSGSVSTPAAPTSKTVAAAAAPATSTTPTTTARLTRGATLGEADAGRSRPRSARGCRRHPTRRAPRARGRARETHP